MNNKIGKKYFKFIALAGVIFSAFAIFNYYFSIVFWGHLGKENAHHCIKDNYSVFLLKKKHDEPIERDGLYIFKVKDIALFKDNTLFVKYVRGVAGDRLTINDREEIIINGKVIEKGFPYLHKANKNIKDFIIEETIIPEGQYFVLGDTEYSFDSRYWGFINEDQIVGKAYGLLRYNPFSE